MMPSAEVLLQGLEIFVVGWGGIFIVMAVLYVVIKVLLKVFPAEDEEKDEQTSE